MPAKHVAMHGAWPGGEVDREGPGHKRQMTRYAASSSGSSPHRHVTKGGGVQRCSTEPGGGGARSRWSAMGDDATGRSSPELPVGPSSWSCSELTNMKFANSFGKHKTQSRAGQWRDEERWSESVE